MNKYVVITGASSGIGYEIAKAFAALGKNLILVARRKEKLLNLKNEISNLNKEIDVQIYNFDLSNEEEVYSFYQCTKKFNIEVFINNAGLGHNKAIINQELDQVNQIINVNIRALTLLSTLYVKDYSDIEGSQLINVSSIGGYSLANEAVSYCASKFYVSSFTEGLNKELKVLNKKLVAKVLAPSATETEFMKISKGINNFNYSGKYNTAKELGEFTIQLYNSNKEVGIVDENYKFQLIDGKYPFRSKINSKGE